MPTMTVEQETRRFISQFRASFGNVSNLTPTVFLDREGEYKTGSMYHKPRSSNVCHLRVRARIQMKNLSGAFDDSIVDFNLMYYIHLPQSFVATTVQSDRNPSLHSMSSVSGSKTEAHAGIDNFDANVFSPTKKRRTEFFPGSVSKMPQEEIDGDKENEGEKQVGKHLTFDDAGLGT